MNDNIDLTKILKDCPKGWKFYTPVWGEVSFDCIYDNGIYVISIATERDYKVLTKEGCYLNREDAECIFFPSKDQRDWSKFTASWYKKDKFDPKTLKSFDRVLVSYSVSGESNWKCKLFSHIDNNEKTYKYDCCDALYAYCIPYNDDTKHLVGTAEEAPEYYRYWED